LSTSALATHRGAEGGIHHGRRSLLKVNERVHLTEITWMVEDCMSTEYFFEKGSKVQIVVRRRHFLL
jgi:hypothetical protein